MANSKLDDLLAALRQVSSTSDRDSDSDLDPNDDPDNDNLDPYDDPGNDSGDPNDNPRSYLPDDSEDEQGEDDDDYSIRHGNVLGFANSDDSVETSAPVTDMLTVLNQLDPATRRKVIQAIHDVFPDSR
jgi:hypothetical protein